MLLVETKIVCRLCADNEVGTLVHMVERLAAVEMFWVRSGSALGSAKGLGLRLAERWNELVSHYDDSETSKGIRNFKDEKTL